MRSLRLPFTLLFTLLLAFALPAFAGEPSAAHPKEFIGTWTIIPPAEASAQLAEVEKALAANPDDALSKQMLEMMKMALSMEMEFADTVKLKMGDEVKDGGAWTATKNDDGSWTLTVTAPDGKADPANATVVGDVLTITEKDKAEKLQFKRKK